MIMYHKWQRGVDAHKNYKELMESDDKITVRCPHATYFSYKIEDEFKEDEEDIIAEEGNQLDDNDNNKYDDKKVIKNKTMNNHNNNNNNNNNNNKNK